MAVMYDSIYPDTMPDDGDIYCGYVDGIYSNFDAVKAHNPGRAYKSISAVGRNPADIIDIEPGCVWPPVMATGYLARNPDADVYCAVSQLAYVSGELGRNRRYWTAHYGQGKHICSKAACGYDTSFVNLLGTQWGGDVSSPGLHFDVSEIQDPSWHSAATAATPIAADAVEVEDDMANYLPLVIAGIDGAAAAIAHGGDGFQSAYYVINRMDNTYWWINGVQKDWYAGSGVEVLEGQGGALVDGMTFIPPNLVKS